MHTVKASLRSFLSVSSLAALMGLLVTIATPTHAQTLWSYTNTNLSANITVSGNTFDCKAATTQPVTIPGNLYMAAVEVDSAYTVTWGYFLNHGGQPSYQTTFILEGFGTGANGTALHGYHTCRFVAQSNVLFGGTQSDALWDSGFVGYTFP